MQELPDEEKGALVRFADKVGQYVQAGLEGAPNTRRAYQADLRHYASWCQQQGLAVFPAEADILSAYLAPLADGSALKDHLIGSAAHMRLLTMGVILILVLRFSPRGLIPER